MTTLQVALNVSRLSVSGLIGKAQLVTQRVADNAASFPNCTTANNRVIQGIADLKVAQAETRDRAKSKIAIMHDKQKELMNLLGVLGHYIEEAANGDAAIIHISGLDVRKKKTSGTMVGLSIRGGEYNGSIKLKVKARQRTVYKWQYRADMMATGPWSQGFHTSTCKTVINGLAPGIYWFRVIFIDGDGEHEQVPVSFAVN